MSRVRIVESYLRSVGKNVGAIQLRILRTQRIALNGPLYCDECGGEIYKSHHFPGACTCDNQAREIHDLKPGEAFLPECLYIHDNGAVYCGAHVGTEATYQPQAWSCLGRGPVVTFNGLPFQCETPHRGENGGGR